MLRLGCNTVPFQAMNVGVGYTFFCTLTLCDRRFCICLFVAANSDYIPLQEEFVFTSTGPNKQCVALQTLRDNAVEDTEALNILVNTTGIEVRPSLLHLNILPADDSMSHSLV